jgi:hypothetical protein
MMTTATSIRRLPEVLRRRLIDVQRFTATPHSRKYPIRYNSCTFGRMNRSRDTKWSFVVPFAYTLRPIRFLPPTMSCTAFA